MVGITVLTFAAQGQNYDIFHFINHKKIMHVKSDKHSVGESL